MLNKIKDVLNKKKGKIIRDVEHIGDIPKPQGRLLHLVEECPLWGMIIALFVFIAIEMPGFAWLYSVISASSFLDSFDYSLFSVLGETAVESVQNSLWINRLISIQSIITNCVISFFMAIVLYKLINIKPKLIKVEDHLVFDPTTGILRLRIANTSKFSLTNVHIDAVYRIYLPEANRHASAKLQLKFDNIYIMDSYSVWNIATKPFLPKHGDCPQLDKARYDNERVYEFIPDMLNEEYRFLLIRRKLKGWSIII